MTRIFLFIIVLFLRLLMSIFNVLCTIFDVCAHVCDCAEEKLHDRYMRCQLRLRRPASVRPNVWKVRP